MKLEFLRTKRGEKCLKMAQAGFLGFVVLPTFSFLGWATREKNIITMGRYDVNGDGVVDALVFTRENGDTFLDYYDGRIVKSGEYGADKVKNISKRFRIDTKVPLNYMVGDNFSHRWLQSTDDNRDGVRDSKDVIDLNIYSNNALGGKTSVIYENIFDANNIVPPRPPERRKKTLLESLK